MPLEPGVQDVFDSLPDEGKSRFLSGLSAEERAEFERNTQQEPTVTEATQVEQPTAPTVVGANRLPGAGLLGSSLSTVAPVAAVAYGANAVSDFAQGEKLSTLQKGAMAIPTAGLSLFSDQLQDKFKIGQPSGDEIMAGRISALSEQGIDVPDAQKRVDDYGASKEELIAREQANIDAGLHGNATFAESRDEADLTPEDTWGGLMWFETLGDDYLGSTAENQRREMNQRALDEGLIDEARGQLNTNDPERLQEIYNEVLDDTPALNPEAVKDGEPEQFRVPEARSGGGGRKPARPKPMNDVSVPDVEEPPLITLPPPQPELKTPKDYAQAYVDVFQTNQGLPANPQLSGRY